MSSASEPSTPGETVVAGGYPRPERRWVLAYACILLAFTTLPYALGYSSAGDDWRFTGFVFGVEDGNSYIAKMLSGSAGAWLFRSPYSAYPQSGHLAFLPYLILGKLASGAGLHEQLVALFHLFRLAAGFLCVLAVYDFLAFFLGDIRLRRIGLILITAGGGLGWFLVLFGRGQWLGSLPLEFYSPETFGFLGIYGVPHLALGRAALLWCLLVFFKAAKSEPYTRRQVFSVTALWLLAGLAQPLDALVIGYVISLHLLVGILRLGVEKPRDPSLERRVWLNALRFTIFSAILPALFILYNGIAFLRDTYLSAWTEQNIIRSPHPLHYLLAYGLLIPFAYLGYKRLVQRFAWHSTTLAAWVISLPILAYLPFNLQRRLPEGIWVALVILALSFFLQRDGSGFDLQRRRWQLLFGFMLPSTFFLLIGGVLAVSHPGEPVFRPAGEIQAFEALRQSAQPGEVVLASYDTGNALPAWAPLKVVIGHGPESANLAEFRPQVEGFFELSSPESERQALLQQFRVRYVFWGPKERNLGEWDPGKSGYLERIYSEPDYAIYKVLDGTG